jgi:5'-methylthioadenosine phosphorylase
MSGGHVLGIIGGSGLYQIDGLTGIVELARETPFGPPSDVIVRGQLGDVSLLFLPRHGRGHTIAPHRINARANVWALKELGATHLVSVSAVGSMREEIAPGEFVVVDQFIDLTKGRASTFFDEGVVAHVAFAEPVCSRLSEALALASESSGVRVHRGGTYVCIEGPQFSTRAESLLYRSWGVSVIGMTALPEAKLAREAELPYALLALATDYDCWHGTEPTVDVASVLAVIQKNVAAARRAIGTLARSLPDPAESSATSALASAVITPGARAGADGRLRLDRLVGQNIRRERGPS